MTTGPVGYLPARQDGGDKWTLIIDRLVRGGVLIISGQENSVRFWNRSRLILEAKFGNPT